MINNKTLASLFIYTAMVALIAAYTAQRWYALNHQLDREVAAIERVIDNQRPAEIYVCVRYIGEGMVCGTAHSLNFEQAKGRGK
jgi:hypothetical protein